ncbi:MAG: 2-C-methyl-D-erythritol 4-phosphate cytidylyltransferase [Nitrospinota bacterium]
MVRARPRGSPQRFKTAAIVPAAGAGTRLGAAGAKTFKQFRPLAGLPVLVHVLRALDRSSVDAVYVAAPPGQATWVRREMVRAYGVRKVRAVVSGGSSRGESVRKCVERVPAGFDVLLVHDGARPLVTPELIDAVTAAAYEHGAALAAVAETDTVKSVRRKGAGGWVRRTVSRESLWRAQTPQAFRAEGFREALRRAAESGFDGPDDASFVEGAGGRVWVVPGDFRNLKVTSPTDLMLAEALLSESSGKKRLSGWSRRGR